VIRDNNEALRDTINQTAERLKAVDKAVDNGVPNTALARMKIFTEYVMNSIQDEILTSEVCVSVKHSGDLANGRRDVWQTS
jgi:hypothetical protein